MYLKMSIPYMTLWFLSENIMLIMLTSESQKFVKNKTGNVVRYSMTSSIMNLKSNRLERSP